jgi:tRNA G26 N,N-dimethylase Trm1
LSRLDGLVGTETMDPYYVCDQCGHYWTEPARPDRCEHCRTGGSWLTPMWSLDAAEEWSEQVLRTRRRAETGVSGAKQGQRILPRGGNWRPTRG